MTDYFRSMLADIALKDEPTLCKIYGQSKRPLTFSHIQTLFFFLLVSNPGAKTFALRSTEPASEIQPCMQIGSFHFHSTACINSKSEMLAFVTTWVKFFSLRGWREPLTTSVITSRNVFSYNCGPRKKPWGLWARDPKIFLSNLKIKFSRMSMEQKIKICEGFFEWTY